MRGLTDSSEQQLRHGIPCANYRAEEVLSLVGLAPSARSCAAVHLRPPAVPSALAPAALPSNGAGVAKKGLAYIRGKQERRRRKKKNEKGEEEIENIKMMAKTVYRVHCCET